PEPAALLERVARAVETEASRWPEVNGVSPYTLAAEREGDEIILTVDGKAVHSSTADAGHNALWPLARVVTDLEVAPNAQATMLRAVAEFFAGDHHGERLGLAHEHPRMGKLLVAATVLRNEGNKVSLGVNLRRPAGLTKEAFAQRL